MKQLGWLLIALSMAVTAKASVFDNPENLTHLPEDISAEQLRAVMIKFNRATGLRCSGCHVGEEGEPLESYDFASDEKRFKKITRQMMDMVTSINSEHLSQLKGNKRINCMTCHRGITEPYLTGTVLNRVLRKEGINAMKARYLELRELYYGTHSYDFSERVLVELAQKNRETDAAAAEGILLLNLDYFPDSFDSHYMLGELYLASGRTQDAREALQRADAINPHPKVKKALQSLSSEENN